MSNIVKHGGWSVEAAEAVAAEANKGQADFYKAKAGANPLRFLPPAEGSSSPLVVTYQHFINLPDGSKASFNCARMMAKSRCPACERMDELLRSGNDADYKASWDFKAKLRVFANVVDRDDEERGVQVFAFGKSILDQLLAIRKDARAGGDFTDPEDGFDIIVTKKGEGMRTEYSVLPARSSSPLSEDTEQFASWLNGMYDLSRYLKVPTYAEASAKLSGDDVARDERPAARSSGRVEVLPPANTGKSKKQRIDDDIPY